MILLLKGILLGFSIAAPVGPIGVLCIRRTLAKGFYSGLVSGFGAATADALYGTVAALGLSVVATFLLEQQFMLRLGGGLFLLYLAVTTYRSNPPPTAVRGQDNGLWSAYVSTLLLTVANPMTLLSFSAIFVGVGIENHGMLLGSPVLLVIGVFIGSMAWWLFLCAMVNRLRQQFDSARLKWINRLSGLILFGFGFYCLFSVIAG